MSSPRYIFNGFIQYNPEAITLTDGRTLISHLSATSNSGIRLTTFDEIPGSGPRDNYSFNPQIDGDHDLASNVLNGALSAFISEDAGTFSVTTLNLTSDINDFDNRILGA